MIVAIDQTQIDCRVAAIRNDGEQDVIAGLRRTLAFFNGLDACLEHLLIELEVIRRLGGDNLPFAGRDGRDFHILLQFLRQDDVGEGAEHGDQLRHVDEGGEARDGLVFARGLQFELGRHIAEGRGPGIELVQPTLFQGIEPEEALHREHLSKCVGDRRAGGEHQCPAGVLRLDEPRLHIEVPGALRPVRIDALQRRHVGGKGEFSELLRLVDDDLVDADLGDGQEIVLDRAERLEPVPQSLLQPLQPLARHPVVAFDPGEQLLIERQLILYHLPFEFGRDSNELEGRMGDDDRVPVACRGARQEAMALVLGEVGLVGNEDPRRRIEREEFAGGLRQAVAGHDQHGFRDQAEAALLHDGGRHRHGLAGADGVGEIGRPRRDDPPDAAFLVAIKNKGARGAR